MPASVSNTVYGIIADAMVDAGLLGEGEDPNSEQLHSNMRRLCDIINLWQTQGIKLFLQEEISITLVANQINYTVTPPTGEPSKHLRIVQARIEDTSGNSRNLNAISWNQWNTLPLGQSGTVTGYLVNKQPSILQLKLWNAPDSTEALNTLVLLVNKQVTNPINLLETMAFPQEWRIALRWGLADDICTGQPQAIMDRCQQRAMTYRQMLEDWDVEDAETRMTPMYPAGYNGGSFR